MFFNINLTYCTLIAFCAYFEAAYNNKASAMHRLAHNRHTDLYYKLIYSIPCDIMARATFMKPATFAPLT